MNSSIKTLFCILMLVSGSVNADPKSKVMPEDFAYGISMYPSDEHGLQGLLLPKEYYKNTVNGSDIRVFDRNGQSIPYVIKHSAKALKEVHYHELPIYPVDQDGKITASDLSVRLERKDSSIAINLSDQLTGTGRTNDHSYYVIDNSYSLKEENKEKRLTDLELSWSEPKLGFVKNISLHTSSDLNRWVSLARGLSLSRLEHSGTQIGNNSLSLSRSVKEFIRLTTKTSPFVLDKVKARYEWQQPTLQAPQHVMQKQLTLIDAADDASEEERAIEEDAYYFTVDERVPLVELKFSTISKNYYYTAQLFVRDADDQRWLRKGTINQYHLKLTGDVIKSEPLQLTGERQSKWLIKFTRPEQLVLAAVPAIELIWQPEFLVFLAQGEAPYTLAFGAADAPPAKHNLSGLLEELSAEDWAELSNRLLKLDAPFELGGVAKLSKSPAPTNWRNIILWLVLILGVVVMAWMALHLYKQMNESSENTGGH